MPRSLPRRDPVALALAIVLVALPLVGLAVVAVSLIRQGLAP